MSPQHVVEACLPSTTAGAHHSTRDTMALSVILPLFNHAQFVGKAISELLSQDPPPDEIIVADDASTDDSLAIVR